LPEASAREVNLGRALALLASTVFFLVALWEIAAPFGAGHFAASTAVTLAGENMLRFHTLLPVTDQLPRLPTTADCYCHHPFGIFWTAAAFVAVLGHHDFVCRLPPLLFSALTPALLYGLGRALWSPLCGALAAVAFVLTPIALSYANFNALEVPVIFGTLLSSLGYVRARQTGRKRWLLVTVLGLAFAVNSDWPAFVFAGELLLLLFLRTFVFERRLLPDEFRASARLFAWGGVVVCGIGLAYVITFARIGQLEELLAQGKARSVQPDRSIADTLAARGYWLALMFTPLAIAIGKLAVPVLGLRALWKRDEREAIPLALLGMASFQYFVFSQGADVHVFWPHYFAPYFALGLAAIAQSSVDLARWQAPRLKPWFAARARFLLPALGFLVPMLMARDAFTALIYARKTGGRFNERGSFIQPDKDKVAALEFLSERAAKGAIVGLDPNMKRSLWVPWVLERPTRVDGTGTIRSAERYFVTDGRFARSESLLENSRRASTTVVGPFWIFDRGEKPGPAQGYRIERREPGLFERYFVSSTHALRKIEADPFWTWEVRDHLRQTPNPEPTIEPATPEQVRIAHNIAWRNGDRQRAQLLRERLLLGADTRAAKLYEDGTRLLATRFEPGASDVLSVYFESSGPAEQRFRIRSRVEARMPGSLVPRDTLEWEVGLPSLLQRDIWRAGYLYVAVTEVLKRPGHERFVGAWINTGFEPPLAAKDGSREVTLLVLP
jgi:4-amino-4-deoxy-L-arabinose transferase-like glycosyltransferase